jgi:hypothetical protein
LKIIIAKRRLGKERCPNVLGDYGRLEQEIE